MSVLEKHEYANDPPTLRDSHPGDPLSFRRKRSAKPGSLVVSILPRTPRGLMRLIKIVSFGSAKGESELPFVYQYMVSHRH